MVQVWFIAIGSHHWTMKGFCTFSSHLRLAWLVFMPQYKQFILVSCPYLRWNVSHIYTSNVFTFPSGKKAPLKPTQKATGRTFCLSHSKQANQSPSLPVKPVGNSAWHYLEACSSFLFCSKLNSARSLLFLSPEWMLIGPVPFWVAVNYFGGRF